MHARFYRKPTFLIVSAGVVMLAVGLAVGLAFGSGKGAAHATPAQGFIDIYNGTNLYACVNPPAPGAFGCTPYPQLSNVCQPGGNDEIVCDVQEPPHSGGTLRFDNYVPCFDFTPQGVVAASNSEIAYSSDGKVVIRCTLLP